MFFIAYAFKGHVHAFAGRVKVVSHSSGRTSAIFKYFCPLDKVTVFNIKFAPRSTQLIWIYTVFHDRSRSLKNVCGYYSRLNSNYHFQKMLLKHKLACILLFKESCEWGCY